MKKLKAKNPISGNSMSLKPKGLLELVFGGVILLGIKYIATSGFNAIKPLLRHFTVNGIKNTADNIADTFGKPTAPKSNPVVRL